MGLLTAVLVAFAAAIATASPAAATEPGFFRCSADPGGRYRNAACSTTSSPGSYERTALTAREIERELAGEAIPFSSDVNGALTVRAAKFSLHCASFSIDGQTNGPNKFNQATLDFKECEETRSKEMCGTEFSRGYTTSLLEESLISSHEFVSNGLEGTLVYLNKSKTKIGVLLETEVVVAIAEFNCGATTFVIEGEVLGEVGAVNSAQTTNAIVFAENGAGTEQKYTEVEVRPPKTTPLIVGADAEDAEVHEPLTSPRTTWTEEARLTATANVSWRSSAVGVGG